MLVESVLNLNLKATLSVESVYSTAQHSTAPQSTAQHSTAQHSTAQHSTAQQQYNTIHKVNFPDV